MSKKKKLALRVMVFCIAGAAALMWLAVSELLDRKAGTDYYASVRNHVYEAEHETGREVSPEATQIPDIEISEITPEEKIPTTVPVPEYERASALDFEALSETMPDVCGWLTVPGTVIDYPIVQGSDNAFYLEHLPDGTANRAGSIMLDAENAADWSDDVSLIHGHHMRAGTMFGSLQDFEDEDFAAAHSEFMLYTPQGDHRVALIAACTVDGEQFGFDTAFESDILFDEYIGYLISRSAYVSDIIPVRGDRLILLSTCAYTFDNARFVVLGMLLD